VRAAWDRLEAVDAERQDVAKFVLDQVSDNRWLRQAPLITA